MKKLILASLACGALVACQAETEDAADDGAEVAAADDAAVGDDDIWGGTYETTNADGDTATWNFAEDGTYTVTGSDGQTGSGTYTSGEGSTCLDRTEAEGEEDTGVVCYTQSEPGEDGSWTSTGPDGDSVTVRSVG